MAGKAKRLAARPDRPRRGSAPGTGGGGQPSAAAAHVSSGLACHRAGDLDGAATYYRKALGCDPENAEALHLLGVARYHSGDHSGAVDLLRRAVKNAPGNAEIRSNLGAALLAAGNPPGAVEAFREATRLAPAYVDAHANLAAALVRLGQIDAAIDSFATARRLKPEATRFAKRLGELCLDRERLAEAADWFAAYLAHAPDDASALNNAALACERMGRLTEAEAHYRCALEHRPASPEIANNLANVLQRLGRTAEADALFDRALAAPPEAWENPASRAGALCNRGEFELALSIYGELAGRRPDDAGLHEQHGRALMAAGRYAAAEAAFRRALALDPEMIDALIGRGDALHRLDRDAEAIAALESAVTRAPHHLRLRLWLAVVLNAVRRFDAGYESAAAAVRLPDFRKAMFVVPHQAFRATCAFDDIDALDISVSTLGRDGPDIATVSIGFLNCLVLADGSDEIAELARLHRRWGEERMKEAAANPLPLFPRQRPPGPLRVGMVSSDLCNHSVGRFVMPLIQHYDRDRLQFFCYSPNSAPNDVTQRRIRERVAAFRVIGDLAHRDFAEAVRADGVDILFELNGFTGQSRLKALAFRPAPVQVYWLGYPFTTGLPAMDYIMVDDDLTPENADWLVEKPLPIPGSWVCYDPFEIVPVTAAPPMTRNGFVTFGTLNNPYKFTRDAVALWSRVLHAVPGSRFLLVRKECESVLLRRNLTAEFARNGIDAGRLRFVSNQDAQISHFAYYDEIDLSLDSFPLTGGTTTADALWMGVPVITLVGPSLHQRISYAILRKAGLDDLCTRTPADFVARAVALAGDEPRLRELRAGLRSRLQDSPLGCGTDFARRFADLMEQLAARHGLR